jgi:uncharacterized membrane protein YgaE (UPF0421/DUF939 family)
MRSCRRLLRKIYDEKLAKVRSRYRANEACVPDSKDYLLTKLETDHDTTKHLIAAYQDGKLDAREKRHLRHDLETIRKNCDVLEAMLNLEDAAIGASVTDLRIKATKSIERRNGTK